LSKEITALKSSAITIIVKTALQSLKSPTGAEVLTDTFLPRKE
jgi:hypothetical protein